MPRVERSIGVFQVLPDHPACGRQRAGRHLRAVLHPQAPGRARQAQPGACSLPYLLPHPGKCLIMRGPVLHTFLPLASGTQPLQRTRSTCGKGHGTRKRKQGSPWCCSAVAAATKAEACPWCARSSWRPTATCRSTRSGAATSAWSGASRGVSAPCPPRRGACPPSRRVPPLPCRRRGPPTGGSASYRCGCLVVVIVPCPNTLSSGLIPLSRVSIVSGFMAKQDIRTVCNK